MGNVVLHSRRSRECSRQMSLALFFRVQFCSAGRAATISPSHKSLRVARQLTGCCFPASECLTFMEVGRCLHGGGQLCHHGGECDNACCLVFPQTGSRIAISRHAVGTYKIASNVIDSARCNCFENMFVFFIEMTADAHVLHTLQFNDRNLKAFSVHCFSSSGLHSELKARIPKSLTRRVLSFAEPEPRSLSQS